MHSLRFDVLVTAAVPVPERMARPVLLPVLVLGLWRWVGGVGGWAVYM